MIWVTRIENSAITPGLATAISSIHGVLPAIHHFRFTKKHDRRNVRYSKIFTIYFTSIVVYENEHKIW